MTTTADYLTHLAEQGRPDNTLAAYANDYAQLERFLVRRLGSPEVRWAEVADADLEAWANDLEERVYAPSSRARKLAALGSFVKWAGLPLLVPKPPGVPPARERFLGDDEQTRLVAAARPGRDRAMLLLMLDCGLRASEVVGLDGADVAAGFGYLRLPGRDVPLTQRLEALDAFWPREPRGPVFVNHRGERLTRQGLWLVITEAARRARLADPSARVLRATCARNLFRSGAGREDVAAVLGVTVYQADRYAPAARKAAA